VEADERALLHEEGPRSAFGSRYFGSVVAATHSGQRPQYTTSASSIS
jgi:type IV secretory pathway protease TraF